jgi:hypothetical protein
MHRTYYYPWNQSTLVSPGYLRLVFRSLRLWFDELTAKWLYMRDCFDALSKWIVEAHAGVPIEEGRAEIDSLVAQERAH